MRKEGSDRPGILESTDAALPGRPVMKLLYRFFLFLYYFAIRAYSLFNSKAGKWVNGRKEWEQFYLSSLHAGEQRIWVHCSSVGEFEQAKPLIEALKETYPVYKIVLTFFSPSGYDAYKSNSSVDYVYYLPPDSKRNAEKFISLIAPSLAIFVKYEFWYFYLSGLKTQHIPVVLVSGTFRPEQPFFKWYGGLFRDMLRCFSFFFLQDEESKELLVQTGFAKNAVISGDTRYDRVAMIAKNANPVSAIEQFKGDHKILIAGSTWPGDEDVLKNCMATLPANWKIIIAPHEIDEGHIRKIQQQFGKETILYSELDAENTGHDKRILIINNIGMLSRLFAYGDIAFIGGGFFKGGIHNILEPAVFGLPVIFGPVYDKYVEAKQLVALQVVFPVNNTEECNLVLKKLIFNEGYRDSISSSLKNFMQRHTGATAAIMNRIWLEQWLH